MTTPVYLEISGKMQLCQPFEVLAADASVGDIVKDNYDNGLWQILARREMRGMIFLGDRLGREHVYSRRALLRVFRQVKK